MQVKPISGEAKVALTYLLIEQGISEEHVERIIMPRIFVMDGQAFFNTQFEDIDLSQINNSQKFTRMRTGASKYLIPIPQDCGEIQTTTIIATSEGTEVVESNSVGKPGDFVVVNNPTPKALAAMQAVQAQLADAAPKERIEALIQAAQDNGSKNIFPAGRDFENALEGVTAPITEPGLFQVKPSMPRAIARFSGPTIIDQTSHWGSKADGSPNYQVQPNTVFIVHLDKEGAPILNNDLVKANGYELKPFTDDYRTLDGRQLSITEVTEHVPLVPFQGELASLNEREVEALGNVLLEYNRELRTGRVSAVKPSGALRQAGR